MVSTRLSRLEGHRRKFMAVIDNTPECSRAVHYAGRRAKNSNGGLVLIYVIPDGDFQQWLGVEEIMRAEAREEAEAVMAKAAQTGLGHVIDARIAGQDMMKIMCLKAT